MQGAQGRALLAAHGLDPDDPSSFLLIDAQGAHRDTDAIARVVAGLGGAWRVVHAMRVVPRHCATVCIGSSRAIAIVGSGSTRRVACLRRTRRIGSWIRAASPATS